jgi:hypothetical protein
MTNKEMIDEIRAEIARRKKELEALESAAMVLAGLGSASGSKKGSTGRKRGRPKNPIGRLVKAVEKVGKAKRGPGRPRKNESEKAAAVKPVKKGKRGRPPGKKKSIAPKPVKAAKRGRPAGTKSSAVKVSKGKKGGKGIRVTNIHGRLVDHFSKTGKFMTNGDIGMYLKPFYPSKTELELKKYASILLNQLMHDKKIGRTDLDKSGKKAEAYFWGLPEWVEGNKGKSQYYS